MKALWIDRETNMAKVVETDGKLDSLYKMCHCDCIEIVVRKVGGIPFNIVCDDEGLLKGDVMYTAFYSDGTPEIAGSICVFSCDDEWGDLAGLKSNELEVLMNRTVMAMMSDLTSRTILLMDV